MTEKLTTSTYHGTNLTEIRDRVDADIRKHRIIRARRSLVGYRQDLYKSGGDIGDSLKNTERNFDKAVSALVRDNEKIDYLLDLIEELTGVELEDGE